MTEDKKLFPKENLYLYPKIIYKNNQLFDRFFSDKCFKEFGREHQLKKYCKNFTIKFLTTKYNVIKLKIAPVLFCELV